MLLAFLSMCGGWLRFTFVVFNDINTFRKPCNFTLSKRILPYFAIFLGYTKEMMGIVSFVFSSHPTSTVAIFFVHL